MRISAEYKTAVRGLALTLALFTGTGGSLSASADPWPVQDRNWTTLHPDGGYFYYCVYQGAQWPDYAVPNAMKDNMMSVTLNALGGGTEASTNYHECDFNPSGGLTDGVFEELELGSGVLGETWCNSLNASGNCDRADIVLNQRQILQGSSGATATENEYDHTGCHELGHAVGLSHYAVSHTPPASEGGNDCMRSGRWDSGHSDWRTYNTHHKGHINSWFVPQ